VPHETSRFGRSGNAYLRQVRIRIQTEVSDELKTAFLRQSLSRCQPFTMPLWAEWSWVDDVSIHVQPIVKGRRAAFRIVEGHRYRIFRRER
jgi:hypothetical protein